MKFAARTHFTVKEFTIIGLISVVGLAALAARADDSVSADNPYVSIPARNIFNLVPIPTNPPPVLAAPDPPSKITPNGIMSLFGSLQVLFKVANPPKPGQPPTDQSYVMSEGDREDGISVLRIDQAVGVITFDNHGITQKLPLVATTDTDSGHSGKGGFDGHFPRRDLMSSTPPPANDGGGPSVPPTSFAGAQAKLDAILNDPNHLTPEAQVILMEANRQQLQQAGDPTAALIPSTELTDQMQGPGGDSTAGPSSP